MPVRYGKTALARALPPPTPRLLTAHRACREDICLGEDGEGVEEEEEEEEVGSPPTQLSVLSLRSG